MITEMYTYKKPKSPVLSCTKPIKLAGQSPRRKVLYIGESVHSTNG